MTFMDPDELKIGEAPNLVWIRVKDAINLLWQDNPKLHDIGGIVQSIERYGLQELPKWDKLLRNRLGSMGAIKAGNGRIEALAWMERDTRYALPRGLAVNNDGEWVVPILAGIDAESEQQAIAYAVDSNILTMLGGDFTLTEIAKLWNKPGLVSVLGELDQDSLPVSIDADDFRKLQQMLDDSDYLAMLELMRKMGIPIDGPSRTVKPGDIYRILGNHLLICEDVYSGWPNWVLHLNQGSVFLPYPGPYVLFTKAAKTESFVMVQPDTLVMGWILDICSQVYGDSTIVKIS